MLLESSHLPLAFIGSLGAPEMMFVALIALLVFGKDLPHVAREWAKHFAEFRRHVNGIKSELTDAIYAAELEPPRLQYHPEFHNRDPLPEAIPAEANGDLSATASGDVSTVAPGDVVATQDATVSEALPPD
jgi:Sec-independent protein translocase protein TatA